MVLFKALSRCWPEGTREFQGDISLAAVGLRKEDEPWTSRKRITKSGNLSASFGTKAKLNVRELWDEPCSGRIVILLACDVFWANRNSSGM